MGGPQYNSPTRRLARMLRSHIELGLYARGERLPPLAASAAQYNVTVTVVRKAHEILRREGLIVSIPGDGTYVMPPDPHNETAPADLHTVTLHTVRRSGINITAIADRLGTSRWNVRRRLDGHLRMTPEWSERIIKAVEELTEEDEIHLNE